MKLTTIVCVGVLMISTWPGIALGAEVGDPVPGFETKSLEGKSISSDSIKGKNSLFLVFWATWCENCKKEIPRLKEIYSTYVPKGMTFLAINTSVNDSLKKAKRYVEKYEIPYPVIFDSGSEITKRFAVRGTPTIIIVDKQGIIRYRSADLPGDLAEHFEALMKSGGES
ncbi:MAG: TlpA family protein disulfide reductase [Desulfomonile tiedjei]|uniref:TlpA family protein disulfide reductase n=1 Tax=Desulfomonile tiedjei TaxID=2358 RepID=A0A9D6UZL1_9BACT|nr:TlpA family protein disulfide reductase [Desulfomonile tiedjei]